MANDATVIKILKSLSLAESNLDIRDSKELGRGAYGRVFTVKYCGQSFAAKEIHSMLLNAANKRDRDSMIKKFLHECHHCVQLRHPNVVQFIGVYWPNRKSHLPVMVMELMDWSLKIFIENKPRGNIKLCDKYSILHDVALGLSFLHAQNPPVVHRDLSPNNILLTDRSVAKIGDLGVARAIQAGGKLKKNAILTEAPGTAAFMPPEAMGSSPVYDASLDVFSFGGIVLFVITEQWPEPTLATEVDPSTRLIMGFTEVQRRRKYLSKMDRDDYELRNFVESCLDNDPKSRPFIRTVVEKIESLQLKLQISEVNVKLPPQPPPHSPKPKPRHISVPAGPVPTLPSSVSPRHVPQQFALLPPLSSRDHHRSMPDFLNTSPDSPPRERRSMRVSLTLGEALQKDDYHISWTRCADLPAPMYGASVAVSEQNVYVTAGCAPSHDICWKVFCYDTVSDRWSYLPSPDHAFGILCMVDGKLNLFGGNNSDNTATNKVSTFNSRFNKWVSHFPAMLKKRNKPGVAVYLEHVIVAGGARNINTFNDDIEILNWQQLPLQWQQVDVTLPVPMWMISFTISSDNMLIVGYTQAKGRSTSVYQLPIKSILEQPVYSNQMKNHTWKRLCPAPNHDTALVPCSNPPVIVGGNFRGQATADIIVYSISENRWKNCASLSGPRINVAVASIYDDTIIVFGGYTSGRNVEAAMESSLTTVEMGKVEENEDDDDYLKLIP